MQMKPPGSGSWWLQGTRSWEGSWGEGWLRALQASGGHRHPLGLPWVTAQENGVAFAWLSSYGGGVMVGTQFSQPALLGNLFPNRAG